SVKKIIDAFTQAIKYIHQIIIYSIL
ncbi:MAG: hypothetical protein JWN06_1652, partial [Propionibacteriaceae bacterium]|nr:hypothetical protein [Propionibacteriaceae bacterium]